MSDLQASAAAGQRGPADHSIRDQIIAAAHEQFRRYGYGKTTVADLANVIGFSKAYIYKFFDSKRSIGEAICGDCLDTIVTSIKSSISRDEPASVKLRLVFKIITEMGVDLFFNDRKLYDIAVYSHAEKWGSATAYVDEIEDILTIIIEEGRKSGAFERKTPIDQVTRATLHAFQAFMNPVMLQYNLDAPAQGAQEVADLVLRSLAP